MKRKIIIGIVVLVVVIVAVVCTLSWIGCDRAIHPGTELSSYKLSQFDLTVENIYFKTRDDLTLAGWFILGTNGATVILVHGRESARDKTFYVPRDEEARYQV